MTETERIVAKGIIPETFLQEEIRCDFLVDEKRKKIWTVCLDLLLEIDRVCKKHGLRYFLMYGSLLGAIRHKGFIPWDDDVDIIMFRKDYDVLTKLGEEFTAPYFLQTPETDPNFCNSIIKLRNSNTCFFSKYHGYRKFNSGLLIDVFPLEDAMPETEEARWDEINQLNILNSLWLKMPSPYKTRHDIDRIAKYSNIDCRANLARINEIATMYNDPSTKYVGQLVNTVYSFDREMFLRESFDNTIYADFEGLKLPIPAGYDQILKTTYGDYMEFPPAEKRGSWHEMAYLDPDMSFSDYMKSIGL